MIPNVLTIAGSDPSGGAGIQADLKTFAALGTYGTSVITALTAQNTRGVTGVYAVPPAFVREQLDTLFADVRIDATKIGMLGRAAVIAAVADRLRAYEPGPIVLDPVMVAKSGDRLLDPDAVGALRQHLIPLATVITPNLPETGVLLGTPAPSTLAEMRGAARALHALGARAVLVKGGHLDGEQSPDVLFDGDVDHVLEGPRIETRSTHGTGCTLSSAIAAFIAGGEDVVDACRHAKAYLLDAMRASGALRVGAGHGPVWHGARRVSS
jgi:hydroxymethylpyrimidine/phosphomethylpyrimidine kinase